MTRSLNLMADIDDVIFPTMVSIHDLAHRAGLHDGSAKMAWSGWESYTLPDGSPCTPEIYWDLWSDFALSGGYVSTPPIASAAEALRHLHLEGHRIHLVTARGFMNHADDIRRWTPQWLEEWAIPHDSLTFAKDKVGAQTLLGRFDLAIDDSPSNYTKLSEAGVNVWLQRHDHNADFEASDPDVCAVNDLWEWAKIAERIA